MTPRAGIAPAVMDSRSLFAFRIPGDLSPPSLGLQSLCSLLLPHVSSQDSLIPLWMGRDSSQGEQALGCPCHTNGSNKAKGLRV